MGTSEFDVNLGLQSKFQTSQEYTVELSQKFKIQMKEWINLKLKCLA